MDESRIAEIVSSEVTPNGKFIVTLRFGTVADKQRFEQFMESNPLMSAYRGYGFCSEGRRCRDCGCTEETPCVTGGVPCHWVERDLCSACVSKEPGA